MLRVWTRGLFYFFSISLLLFSPNVAFSELTKLGSSYGGWTIPLDLVPENAICYSVGAGEDITFDFEIIKKTGCQLFCFDPTPRAAKHIEYIRKALKTGNSAFPIPKSDAYAIDANDLEHLHFYPLGLWDEDCVIKFYSPKNPAHVSYSITNLQHTQKYFEADCKKLSTLMRKLGHNHIDILKLDIEGAEYQVIDNMIEEEILPTIFCVEFHGKEANKVEKTIGLLTEAGYILAHVEHKKDYTFVLDRQNRSVKNSLTFHEYFTELFPTDPVTTEYDAYKLLKENPIKKDINYLAMPWAVLINKKMLDTVPDIKLDGGFTVCQHIRYEQILPILEKIGITTLFTPHAKRNEVYNNKVTVLPFPHFPIFGAKPATKDLWYSFIGAKTHKVREGIFALPKRPDTIIIKRNSWHWFQKSIEKQETEQKEYQDALARSRFSLCPRGTGPSTIRFWESMQAGAIPVLLADTMALPEGVNWDDCLVWIAEKDVKKIDQILSKITEREEAAKKAACLKLFKNEVEGKNFVNCIRYHFA